MGMGIKWGGPSADSRGRLAQEETMQQLGKAVSILLRFDRRADACFADLGAFGAPSECHAVVEHGLRREFRQVRRHACRVAGVKNLSQLRRKLKRACPTWDRYNHYRLGIQEV